MRSLLTAGLLTLLLLLNACKTGPDPAEVLAKSQAAMSEAQSYRFAGQIVQERDEGALISHQTGEWAGPDRWRIRLETEVEGVQHVTEVIRLEGHTFTRDSDRDEGAWQELWSQLDPLIAAEHLFVPDLEGLKVSEDGTVDGVPVFQITGERRQERTLSQYRPGQSEPVQQELVTRYTWFIRQEDHRLARRIIEQEVGPVIHRTIADFYDYDQPIVIEAPASIGK